MNFFESSAAKTRRLYGAGTGKHTVSNPNPGGPPSKGLNLLGSIAGKFIGGAVGSVANRLMNAGLNRGGEFQGYAAVQAKFADPDWRVRISALNGC